MLPQFPKCIHTTETVIYSFKKYHYKLVASPSVSLRFHTYAYCIIKKIPDYIDGNYIGIIQLTQPLTQLGRPGPADHLSEQNDSAGSTDHWVPIINVNPVEVSN